MRLAILAFTLLAAGCTAAVEPTTADLDPPGYKVQLRNEGTVTLRGVRVTTGENVPPLTIGELAPGASTGTASVKALHEHPLVTLTVEGRTVTLQPIEGFGGFNAQVAPGSYVIQLRWDREQQALSVRVASH